MKTPTFVVLVLATTIAATAIPASKYTLHKPTCYVDNFDNITTNPVAPQLSKVGTVNGIEYDEWVAAEPGPTSGVRPQSGENVAAATMEQDLLTIGSLTLNAFGNLVAVSGVTFDLKSFYFGCLLNLENSVASIATGCTIAVTGFDCNGNQVPEAAFAFAPDDLEDQPLVLAQLPPSFTNLKNVTIGVADGSLVTSQTILDIDNVVHCNYQSR